MGWLPLIPVGGKAIEGAFFSNHFSTEDKSPLVQDFVKKYKQKYNAVPDAFAALGYDATKLLADAIKRAGSTDPDKIRAAIQDTEGFPGVSGKITIGKDRNAVKSAVILTIKDGALKYAETIEPKPTLASSAQ
jgi:branched-chain amino acid transport system substrate-binding protein